MEHHEGCLCAPWRQDLMHCIEFSSLSECWRWSDKKKKHVRTNPRINLLPRHPGINGSMFDDFHCLWSSLTTLVVRANLLSQDFEALNVNVCKCTGYSSHQYLHLEGPSECLQQDAKKPIRWNSAMSGHTRLSFSSSPLTALFSPVLRALHTECLCLCTVDAAQDDQWHVSQRWLTQQISLECVAMSQFVRHAHEHERLRLRQRYRDYWLVQPNVLQFYLPGCCLELIFPMNRDSRIACLL